MQYKNAKPTKSIATPVQKISIKNLYPQCFSTPPCTKLIPRGTYAIHRGLLSYKWFVLKAKTLTGTDASVCMWIASLPLLLNNGFLAVYQTDHQSHLSVHSNEKLTQYHVSLGLSLVHMLMHQRSSPQHKCPSRKLSQLFHACASAWGEPSGSEAIGTAAQELGSG